MKMKEIPRRWATWVIVFSALTISGCAEVSEAESGSPGGEPVMVEPLGDTGLSRVTLTQLASERLGVETEAVVKRSLARGSAESSSQNVVPYSSLIYDPSGGTWVYTSAGPLAFVREAVTVDFIKADLVALTKGPDTGVEVVSVGAAELYGSELGVDH